MPQFGPMQGLMAADPTERLRAITDKWKQFPGRAPNGTGETGLNSNDAQGWSNMLNEQTEALNINNALQGKGPMQVKVQQEAPLSSVQGIQYGYLPGHEKAAQAAAQKFAQGGSAPSWYGMQSPQEHQMFGNYVQQAIKGLKG